MFRTVRINCACCVLWFKGSSMSMVAFVDNFAALEIDFYVIVRPSMVGDVRTTINHIT